MPDIMTVVEPIGPLHSQPTSHTPADSVLSERIIVNRQSDTNTSPDGSNGDDLERNSFDEKASIRSGDVKFRQEFKGLTLFWLAFQSIG